MNLLTCRRPFFVGVKGIGMAALALIAKELGKEVRGSDVAEKYLTDPLLTGAGIVCQTGFDPEALPDDVDYLVATAAHGGLTNPQVEEAKRRRLPAVSYAQALGEVVNAKRLVAVTGVGGKTTTTAMIASILTKAGFEPGFVIGAAQSPPRGRPGYAGKGEWYVVEADDYVACPNTDRRPKFLFLEPEVAVMTNLEFDHPDVYADIGAMAVQYRRLAEKIPPGGMLVVNQDSPALKSVVEKKLAAEVVTFGFDERADYHLSGVKIKDGGTVFKVGGWGEIELKIPGRLNAMNAAAALAVSARLGVSPEAVKEALAGFSGLKRRFELIGQARGALVYDDYAHHPHEVMATLAAAKRWFPKRRIRVVFQPHTYSRTKALFAEFTRAFGEADEVILLPIFASQREDPDPTVSSSRLAAEMPHPRVSYFDDFASAKGYLRETRTEDDLILTMGAGDVYQLGELLVEKGGGS
jgi:UDP-N-acetylmuramate--alanine ligase